MEIKPGAASRDWIAVRPERPAVASGCPLMSSVQPLACFDTSSDFIYPVFKNVTPGYNVVKKIKMQET